MKIKITFTCSTVSFIATFSGMTTVVFPRSTVGANSLTACLQFHSAYQLKHLEIIVSRVKSVIFNTNVTAQLRR